MANEKIILAELDIDASALIKSTSKLKGTIDSIVDSQKDLKKSGDTSSETFIENAKNLKVLQQAYTQNIKALSENTKATSEAANREKLLSLTLAQTPKSIKEAREQTKILTKFRNEANATTTEGQEEIRKLNNALDANTQFVTDNADGYLKLKLNIGNYKESVSEALNEINPLNGGISGFVSRAEKAGGAGKLLSSSLGAATKGFIGLTKSALAFLLTPVGAVVALIAGGFLLVKNALDRSEESTNKISKAFSGFTGVLKSVLKSLEPLGDILIDGIVFGFKLAEQAIVSWLNVASNISGFFGLDKISETLSDTAKGFKEAADNGRELAAAQASLEASARKARIVTLQGQKDAEKLRQIRDDVSKSDKVRQKANEDIGIVLQQQLKTELAIAQQTLRVAELRIEQEGRTKDALDAQAAAQTEIVDIEERITGQLSEQLVNRVSLQKEAADKAKANAEKAIEAQKVELQLLIESQGIKKKSIEDELVNAQLLADEKLKILENSIAKNLTTEVQGELEKAQILNELAGTQRDLAIENAEFELQIIRDSNQSKIDEGTFLNDSLVQQERDRFLAIQKAESEFQSLRLERGEINEREYNTLINSINDENRLLNKELDNERLLQQREAEAIDVDNQRLINEERFAVDLGLRLSELERRKEIEIANAEAVGSSTVLIDEKFAAQKAQIEADVANNKSELAAGAFGNVAAILGKESKAGKAAAVAQTTITTFQSATSAFNSLSGIPIVGPVLGALAAGAAVASGIANIKKITATKTPTAEKPNTQKFAKGTVQAINGPSHSGGGVPIWAGSQYIGEAEGNEGIGILNRNAFGGFMDFNNSFLSPKSGNGMFPGGGIITSAVGPQATRQQDNNALLEEISNLNVRVAVEEINAGQSNFARITEGAND